MHRLFLLILDYNFNLRLIKPAIMLASIKIKIKNPYCPGTFGLVVVSGISVFTFSCSQKEETRPNIIILLTDDHQWRDLGVMGNTVIRTPHLDHLACNGVLFNYTYVTTSICVCSRASILSGQYTSRHGKNSFRDYFTDEEAQQTYPLLLKNHAEYIIGFIGKYGVGLDYPDKFYDYWAVEDKMQPDYENYDQFGNYIHHNDLIENHIIEFLDEFGHSEKPFNLSVGFKAPHAQDVDPRQFIPQKRFMDFYADIEIPLSEIYDSVYYYNKFPEDFRFVQIFDSKTVMNEARRRWGLRFSDPEKYQESIRNYYRLITGVDEVVGNMMHKLKELELDNDTIVIFASDNGFFLAEHGLAGKWYGHQESVRIPFFIYDPRLPENNKGRSINEMTLNIDFAPTILSMTGVNIPEEMQGEDLTILINGKQESWRSEFYYEHTIDIAPIPKSVGVISEDFTYLSYPELKSGFEEFYDF